jgi:hypothetical protein
MKNEWFIPSSMDADTLVRDMGRKPALLLASCQSEITSLRFQLLSTHRRLTLAPLAHSAWFQISTPKFPYGFFNYIFNPCDLPSFPAVTQLTQNSGFLIAFVNENPEALATAVLGRE